MLAWSILPALGGIAALLLVLGVPVPHVLLAVVPTAVGALVGMWIARRVGRSYRARLAALRQENRRLAHRAAHDALTGLMNRSRFEHELSTRMAACDRAGGRIAVLYVDVDGFKHVNDRFGHSLGDELLRAFAARLQAGVRDCDLIGRLGGDEFAVAVEAVAIEQALAVADQLVDRLSQPYAIGPCRVDVSASIGLAMHPGSAKTPAALLDTADEAMYRAKEAGKCRFEVSRLTAVGPGRADPGRPWAGAPR